MNLIISPQIILYQVLRSFHIVHDFSIFSLVSLFLYSLQLSFSPLSYPYNSSLLLSSLWSFRILWIISTGTSSRQVTGSHVLWLSPSLLLLLLLFLICILPFLLILQSSLSYTWRTFHNYIYLWSRYSSSQYLFYLLISLPLLFFLSPSLSKVPRTVRELKDTACHQNINYPVTDFWPCAINYVSLPSPSLLLSHFHFIFPI